MSSLHLRVATVTLTVAVVLPPSLTAQEEPVELGGIILVSRSTQVSRFDVEPTLVALKRSMTGTPDTERSINASAWIVFALVANGSTLKMGPHRAAVRDQTKWLIERQDAEAGHFAIQGVSCSRGEQLIGALAVTEAYATSDHYRPYKKMSEHAITAMDVILPAGAAPAATVDEFVLSILVARCAMSAKSDPAVVARIDQVLATARSGMKGGKVRRIDAALHLDELRQGKAHPPELTVARAWPANLTADPLHTLTGALAVAAAPMHDKARAAQFETLAALVAARETKGDDAGTWAPAGGFDRITTTAMHAITLALANGPTPLFCAK